MNSSIVATSLPMDLDKSRSRPEKSSVESLRKAMVSLESSREIDRCGYNPDKRQGENYKTDIILAIIAEEHAYSFSIPRVWVVRTLRASGSLFMVRRGATILPLRGKVLFGGPLSG